MHPLVEATAAAALLPLRDCLGDPTAGDSAAAIDPLNAAMDTLDGITRTERAARNKMLEHWSGIAADTANVACDEIHHQIEQLYDTAGEFARTITEAIHATGDTRRSLDSIIDDYYTAGEKLSPQLNTPGGVDALMQALREKTSSAQSRIAAHQANLARLGKILHPFAYGAATRTIKPHGDSGKGSHTNGDKDHDNHGNNSAHHHQPDRHDNTDHSTPARPAPPHAAPPPPSTPTVQPIPPAGPPARLAAGIPMSAAGLGAIPAMAPAPGYGMSPGWATPMMGNPMSSYMGTMGAEQLLGHLADSGVGVASTGSGLISHIADTASRATAAAPAQHDPILGGGAKDVDKTIHDAIRDTDKAIHDDAPVIGDIIHPHPDHTPPPHPHDHHLPAAHPQHSSPPRHDTPVPGTTTDGHGNHSGNTPTDTSSNPPPSPTSPVIPTSTQSPPPGTPPPAADAQTVGHTPPPLTAGGQPGVTGPVTRPEVQSDR